MHKLKILIAVTASYAFLSNTYAGQIPPPNMKDYQPAPPMAAGDFNSSVQTLGKQNQDALNQRVIQTLKSPPLVAPSSNGTSTTAKKPAAVDQTPPPSDDNDNTTTAAPIPASPAPAPSTSQKSTHDNASEQPSDNQNITGFGGGSSTPNNTKDNSASSSWGY